MSPQSNLHSLLNIAADIPRLWRQRGYISPKSVSASPCTTQIEDEHTAEGQAVQILHRLQAWRESQSSDILPQPTEAVFTVMDDFPVFEIYDSASRFARPRDLVYPNVDICVITISYWAFSLSASTDTSWTWRYRYACNICRSMRFCVQTYPFALACLVRFALKLVCGVFSTDSLEGRFCQKLSYYCYQKYRFYILD